jgi:hypothetical protein
MHDTWSGSFAKRLLTCELAFPGCILNDGYDTVAIITMASNPLHMLNIMCQGA